MARRSLGSLTLDLILKMGGFTAGLDKAARIADERSRRINRAMQGLRNTISGVFAGVSFSLLARGIIRATEEQEKALANLEQALESTGGAVGFTSQQLQDFSTEVSRATRFSDEAIQELQARLLAFTKVTGPQFERLTELTLDYATATGKDASEAAQTFGLALNNPATGMTRLRRAGVDLDDQTQKLIKSMQAAGDVTGAQNLLMDELARLYGGRAAASADTFGGAIDQLKNAFGELLEAPGGVNDSKEAIQDLTSILQDPQTVKAAQAVTSALFEGLAKVLPVLRETIEGFGVLFGDGASELYQLDLQLSLLRRKLEGEGPLDIPGILNLGWIEDAPIFIAGSRALQREIDRLIAKRDELLAPRSAPAATAAAGTPGAGSGILPPSAEFLQLEASLKEQIALFGASGEAAKIAYQIQSGALDDLSDAEQQQVLRLAKQYDATVNLANAAKEAAAAEQQLKETYESQLKVFEDQLQLTDAITEADKIRIETTIGALKKLDSVDKQHLIEVAIRVDEKQASEDLRDINLQILELRGNTAEAIKIRFEAEHAEQAELFRQTADPADDAALETLRKLTIDQAKFNELREEAARITDDLARQEERIRNTRESGSISEIDEMRELGAERELTVAQLGEILLKMEAIAATSEDPNIANGVITLRTEIEKLQSQTDLLAKKIESSLKSSFESAFGDIVKGTKSVGDAFGDMVKDIQNMLLDLITQQLVQQLFKGFGTSGMGSGADFIGGLFGGGFEQGGYLQPGKVGIAGEKGKPELIFGGRAGLTVVKHDETVEILRQLHMAHQFRKTFDGAYPELMSPHLLPSRDSGGRGYPGQPVMIGTGAQPELFVPDSPGQFVPNDKIGGATTIIQNFTVQAPQATVSRATQQQIAVAAGRGIRNALVRDG